mmetsp:Transcript_29245/g.93541  ORF Transcript_29245/g.93541 Transcript_29245/m.93541 type:complete len:731 (-) Transcript_29245:21-2213(-)
MLADPVEKCRELSILLISDACEKLPDASALLAQVVPAVNQRVGQVPVQEPSEELRLQLVAMVGGPLARSAGGAAMGKFMDDISLILQRALQDAFHEVKKAACKAVEALCATCPLNALQPHAQILAAGLLANLGHQHSKVRASCLSALSSLVLMGVPDKFIHEAVAPGMADLCNDGTPNVRKQCAQVLALWLGAARPAGTSSPGARPAEWAPDLFPLLLLGVTDEVPDVSKAALERVEAVGAAWEARQAVEAQEGDVAGGVDAMRIDEAGDDIDSGVDAAVLEAAAAVLPPPYKGWPAVGCRKMARGILPQLMPRLIQGAKEWTVDRRSAAARQLHTLLILAGHKAAPHLPDLLPVLVSAVGDDDTATAQRVVTAVHMLGACMPVDDWLELALEKAYGRNGTSAQQASALVVLSGLLHAGGAGEKRPLSAPQVAALAKGLADEDIRGSAHPAVRQQLLAVLTNLVSTGKGNLEGSALDVFHALLQLAALEDDPALRAGASEVLKGLAAGAGYSSLDALAEHHADSLLNRLESSPGGGPAEWAAGTPDRFVFGALLAAMPPRALAAHMPRILDVLGGCMDIERDPRLRIDLLKVLDGLFEDSHRAGALAAVAEEVLGRVLLPALVWRAGKTAAATRFQGIVALGTMLRGGHVSPQAMVAVLADGQFLPTLHTSMDDDFYAESRKASCQVMSHVLAIAGDRLSPEQRRLVYPELLKRMDDSNDEVRTLGRPRN